MLFDAFHAETEQLSLSLHDPNKEPMLARQNNITQLSEVILEQGDARRRIDEFFTEEHLIQKILSLSKGTTHQICFSTGHQELILEQYEELSSMRTILDKLEAQNYTAKIINMMQTQNIPESCTTFVIAGPQLDFAPFEIELLAKHIATGKNIYALIDVGTAPQLSNSFAQYGIILKDNAILELDPQRQVSGGDMSYAVLNTTDFEIHPTAKTLAINILMQGIRSVEIDENNKEQSLIELARTSPDSWAETQYQDGPIEQTEGVDILGPVPVIAIVEIEDPQRISIGKITPTFPKEEKTQSPTSTQSINRDKGAKIIVVGSSSLILDEFTQRGDLGNLDLFLNGISWMNDEHEQLYTRSRTEEISPFLLNPTQIRLIIIISLFITPGTLLLGALSSWFSRRSASPAKKQKGKKLA
jgi:ABC-type uncharacterized transport system involved in gliding motility auxiliary subunit